MREVSTLGGFSEKVLAWHRELLELKTRRSGECLLWTGSLNWDGYGATKLDGRSITVHRISYLMHNGDIPPGMVVRHCCPSGDNRACVNPAHLVLGTRGDNNRDTVKRGRRRRRLEIRSEPDRIPESLGSAKFIRKRAAAGDTVTKIARAIGLPATHVREVVEATDPSKVRGSPTEFEKRFWSKVSFTLDCWIWKAMKSAGYGKINVDRRLVGAHQIAWRLIKGPVPRELVVCHNCPSGDNPTCVNPDHLFLARQTDNLRDAHRKRYLRRAREEEKRLKPPLRIGQQLQLPFQKDHTP